MDNSFVMMTDDSCDLGKDFLQEHGIPVVQLSYTIDNVSYRAYDLESKEFYRHVRAGKMPVTTQVNVDEMLVVMGELLEQGKDVLYIAFSSGLSGTCNSGMIAAKELEKKYPDRRIMVVDSLAASLGQGLIIYKAIQMQKEGKTMEEIYKWVVDNRDHVIHMVAVDDLMHLHRGGRVSKMSAIAGSMLGIKPIVHLNNEGKLLVIDKVRGRKQSLLDVIEKTAVRVGDTPNDFFTVCHADCEEEAQYVADLVSKRFGIKDYLINYIGPVIGSHTGPNVIALFMMGNYK